MRPPIHTVVRTATWYEPDPADVTKVLLKKQNVLVAWCGCGARIRYWEGDRMPTCDH